MVAITKPERPEGLTFNSIAIEPARGLGCGFFLVSFAILSITQKGVAQKGWQNPRKKAEKRTNT